MRNISGKGIRACAAFGVLAAIGVASALSVGCSGGDANSGDSQASALTADRPPQLVMLAFDGSLNLDFWAESRAFAKANNLHFTYFISGPYFLADAKKEAYTGPHHAAGKSDIGFGGPASSIGPRLEQVRLANAEGNEIGSHANGHFDGSSWSEEDWTSEFGQFEKLIFEAGPNNGFEQPDLGIVLKDIVGFRAPLLGYSAGLYPTLKNAGFVYDTSKTDATNYWPQKIGGIWNFPLAQVKIVGSGKKTLSMDYNFYYTQSKGLPDSANKELYKKQMLDTYMQYFESNYFGNRAPVNIGHHFSKWNGGAYWEAMQEFAQRVCSQPEVKCITYKDEVAFMEANSDRIADYRAGNFEKMARPPSVEEPEEVEAPIADSELEANGIVRESTDSCNEEDDSASAAP